MVLSGDQVRHRHVVYRTQAAQAGSKRPCQVVCSARSYAHVVCSARPLQVSGYAIPAANLVQRLRLRMDATSLSGSWYEQQWRQLTAPLHEARVPYAAILGEHVLVLGWDSASRWQHLAPAACGAGCPGLHAAASTSQATQLQHPAATHCQGYPAAEPGGPPNAARVPSHPQLPPKPSGNHDGEADLSRREIMALDAATSGGLSLSRAGPARLSGAGNYWVDVLAPGNSTEVAARLWFLDSGNRGCNGSAAGW